MQTNNDLANKLTFKQIPILPPGVSILFKTLTDDSIGFIELARIIEKFPSIAARLIAVANSSWSSPVTPITSLEMACSRLGFDVVRSTSIALAVAAPFDSNRCPAFNAKYFWTTSLLAADATSWLSLDCKSIQTELPVVRT
ncbi:MAG: HDOD domain-containing protein, partial [Gammaproteobacteria bacterium]